MGVAHHVVGKPSFHNQSGSTLFCGINSYSSLGGIAHDHYVADKSANYLFIVAVLKSMREGGVITLAEYERAKRYYQKLAGSDLVIAD